MDHSEHSYASHRSQNTTERSTDFNREDDVSKTKSNKDRIQKQIISHIPDSDDLGSDLSLGSDEGSHESFHSFGDSEHESLLHEKQGSIIQSISNSHDPVCEQTPERIYSPGGDKKVKSGYHRYTPSNDIEGLQAGKSRSRASSKSPSFNISENSLSDAISLPSSPPNELRQRLGSHDHTPNRARSYTSPETSPRQKLSPIADSNSTTLRRWISSRTGEIRGTPRQSKAVRIVQSYNYDAHSESSQPSETSFRDQDIFARSAPSIHSSSYHGSSSHAIAYPQTIQEEDEPFSRQRAFSEPERSRTGPWRAFFRKREPVPLTPSRQTHSQSNQSVVSSSSVSRTSARPNSNGFLPLDAMINQSSDRLNQVSFQLGSVEDEQGIEMQSHPPIGIVDIENRNNRFVQDDPNREARRNWILINQRFQLIIMIVGVIFSFLVFAIMVTWVVLTSAYVVSIDDPCDLPLKAYFWLATIQLILDVFRIEIMRNILRYDYNESHQQIPTRVIFYNLAYLTYAMLVLRMGINNTFLDQGSTCPLTSKKLFNTTRVFVSISLSAWLFILLGYLIPFCVVAVLLTINGYSPAAELNPNAPNFGVFPIGNSGSAAPAGCIDRMKHIKLEDFPGDYPTECCICLTEFKPNEIIVATECEHVFHKRCCKDWLKQARTCPVCRMDIPLSLPHGSDISEDTSNNHRPRGNGLFSRGPFRTQELAHDLTNLVQHFTDRR